MAIKKTQPSKPIPKPVHLPRKEKEDRSGAGANKGVDTRESSKALNKE